MVAFYMSTLTYLSHKLKELLIGLKLNNLQAIMQQPKSEERNVWKKLFKSLSNNQPVKNDNTNNSNNKIQEELQPNAH